jgi:hypothetical protein
MELKIKLIIVGQSFITNDCLHSKGVLTLSIKGIHLIGDLRMIWSSHTFTDSTLHQSGERGEHIDRWVDTLLMHLSIDIDLTLSDISSKIWNWMGDIVIWHGQNWNLGNRSDLTLDSTSSLIDGGQIGVHVTWVTSSSWYLLSGGRDLSQGISIRGHISKNGQHMHLLLVSQMLSGGQGQSWSDDTLNGRIVGVIHEEHNTVHGAIYLEIGLEESSNLSVYSHSSENNAEIVFVMIMDILSFNERSLSTDLSTDLIMWKTGS